MNPNRSFHPYGSKMLCCEPSFGMFLLDWDAIWPVSHFYITIGTWLTCFSIGEWEESFLSFVKRIIPDSVKQTWHDWRTSMKKAEAEIQGATKVDETVAMAGWGVEEAEAKNKKDASMYSRPRHRNSIDQIRPCNSIGPRLRYSQILHLYQSAPHRRSNTESGKNIARLGLGYWKAYDEGS